jgi:hypothetical protein
VRCRPGRREVLVERAGTHEPPPGERRAQHVEEEVQIGVGSDLSGALGAPQAFLLRLVDRPFQSFSVGCGKLGIVDDLDVVGVARDVAPLDDLVAARPAAGWSCSRWTSPIGQRSWMGRSGPSRRSVGSMSASTMPAVWAQAVAALRLGASALTDSLQAAVRDARSRLPADTALHRAYAEQVAAELAEPGASWARVAENWDRLGCTYHSATAQVRATEEALRSGELAAAQDPPIRSHDAASRLGATTLVGVVNQLARSAPSLLTSDRGAGTTGASQPM